MNPAGDERHVVVSHDDHAFVTEPTSNEVHVIGLDRLRVVTSYVLPQVPNEVVGVTG